MERHMIGISRGCPENQVSWLKLVNFNWVDVHCLQCNVTCWNMRVGSRMCNLTHQAFLGRQPMNQKLWRTYAMPINLDEDSSSPFWQDFSRDDENAFEDSPEELLDQPPSNDVLKSLLADSERTNLTKKLSLANQHNRFLKRQLYVKEDALVNFKSELAVMELEVQALVSLAEEIAKSGIPEGSRKINGKYIQSHLRSRLEVVHEKLKEQIKGVDAVHSKEVSILWCGMAEACTDAYSLIYLPNYTRLVGGGKTSNQSVQVMGSFDGWSQGEHLSPEYTGSFTKFSTTLMLRPGRYEIKFLVDGEWQLSPEFPTVGEGVMQNNLLIVE